MHYVLDQTSVCIGINVKQVSCYLFLNEKGKNNENEKVFKQYYQLKLDGKNDSPDLSEGRRNYCHYVFEYVWHLKTESTR